MPEFQCVCTELFLKTSIIRAAHVTFRNRTLILADALDDDSVLYQMDVEDITCFYKFSSDLCTIGVEPSSDMSRVSWLRFKDEAMCAAFQTQVEDNWPIRTVVIGQSFESYSLQQKVPTSLKLDDIGLSNNSAATVVRTETPPITLSPPIMNIPIPPTSTNSTEVSFSNSLNGTKTNLLLGESPSSLQLPPLSGGQRERSPSIVLSTPTLGSISPPQTAGGLGGIVCQCHFVGLCIQESETRRRLERGLLLQYVQVLSEMLWQSHRELVDAVKRPSYFEGVMSLLALKSSRKNLLKEGGGATGLEELTPAGLSVLQDTEKQVREAMKHFPSQRDSVAKRQEKLEVERWEKVMRTKEIDIRKEATKEKEALSKKLIAIEKERDSLLERWKKELDLSKKLTIDLQQLKEREANILTSSRKREGELHAQIYKLKKEITGNGSTAGGSDTYSNPHTPESTQRRESMMRSPNSMARDSTTLLAVATGNNGVLNGTNAIQSPNPVNPANKPSLLASFFTKKSPST